MTNREIVQTTFEAFQSGDANTAFSAMDPDFEFHNRTDAPGAEGVWKGQEGFVAMMAKVVEAFSEYSLELRDITEHGDRVTLTLGEIGRGRTSGIEMERQIYTTYTLRDGKIAQIVASLEPPGG